MLDRTTPISRRSITKAGAWSVPVIAVGAAAPALAASSVKTAPMSKTMALDLNLVNVGKVGETTQEISGVVPTAAHVGDSLEATFTATIILTEASLAQMRGFTGEGTADELPSFAPNPGRPDLQNVKYTVLGPVAEPGDKTLLISFPRQDIPLPDPANEVRITVNLTPPAEVASGTGSVTASVKEIEVNLTLYRPDGTSPRNLWLKMVPQASSDATLFTAEIVAAGQPLP